MFPIIVLLLLAMFDMGRAVFLYNGLTNAAREGARLAIVNQDKNMILERVESMTFAGPVSNPDVDSLVEFYHQESDGTLGTPCATLSVGCIAVVTPTSDWSLHHTCAEQHHRSDHVRGPFRTPHRIGLPGCRRRSVSAHVDAGPCPRQP